MPERPFNRRGIHDWRWIVASVVFICVLYTTEGALADMADSSCHCSGRDHIIADRFGDWRVRHVFHQDSLQYRYSDARTVILTDNGEEIPFQFNRRAWDNAVSIIVEGWIPRIVFTIDGEEFVYAERAYMHTLFIPADQAVIRAFAMARNPIQVDITYPRLAGSSQSRSEGGADPNVRVVSGVISPSGSAAALRWIRALQ